MREILGYKRGMTRLYLEDGDVVPVTVIEAGPCPIVQVKSADKDGYDALQMGFGATRKNAVTRPQKGHFREGEPTKYLREVRLNVPAEVNVGDVLTVSQFRAGERIDVVGVSKGLGFQGTVRRHGFGGGPKTHGQSDRLRAPGSIGGASYPARTFKGQRMAGRVGNVRVTVRNLQIAEVRPEENLIFLRGAVPGKPGTLVTIRSRKGSMMPDVEDTPAAEA